MDTTCDYCGDPIGIDPAPIEVKINEPIATQDELEFCSRSCMFYWAEDGMRAV